MDDEQASPEPVAEGGLRPIALIINAGKEPDPYLTEADALATWAAVSCLWHPALLSRFAELPRVVDIETPETPGPDSLYVVAAGEADRLPSGFMTGAQDAGAMVVDGLDDRAALVASIRERVGATEGPDDDEDRAIAEDFLALGTARWWLNDLTIAMGHADCLDLENLTRETLAGARAWVSGDRATATNRLRAAFEVLTQAREKFYPVDAYLLDICLLDPQTRPSSLDEPLKARTPLTLLAPGQAIENLAARDPDRMAALRAAISEGWADVVGGAWSESDESLLPWPSILWQYRRGAEAYRRHLDDRNVETWARRRFGMHPQVPQIARRFGLRFAVPLSFDAGKFPLRSEVKRLWESPDGSTLEALYRPPVSANVAGEGVRLPWRIGLTMKDDHTATVGVVHWAGAVSGWFKDLRRVAGYSPVLIRWVTLNDFFHLTDRPFEGVRSQADDFLSPYLEQALARGDESPIARRAAHFRLRARLDAAETVRAIASCLTEEAVDPDDSTSTASKREELIETGQWAEAEEEIDRLLPIWGRALAKGILGESDNAGRPGYLVVNPLGVPRRAAVLLPDAAPNLAADGPLRAAQLTDEGVWAVVELPAFGYAWVPREPVGGGSVTNAQEVNIREDRLRNASLELAVDQATGGLRGVHGPNEATARLGQQLIIQGLVDTNRTPSPSKMVATKVETDYAGPALAQSTSKGQILDPMGRPVVGFEQRFRVWSGRPIAEIDISLSVLDPGWQESLHQSDPWCSYLACRWAWPDKEASLRRLDLFHPVETVAERIETPEAIDISTRRQRTAILFGGLAHHKKHSARMLDTILIAGRETERRFQLAVALDLEFPFQASTEWADPAVVVPTEAGPPRSGPTGWIFTIDNKAVTVSSMAFSDRSGDGRGWGVTLNVLETAGRASRCKIRCFRNPVWARQLDFQDELIIDLAVEDDSVLVELTPHEMTKVDITLG